MLCKLSPALLPLLLAAAANATQLPGDYETPPEIAAAQALTGEVATGANHRVENPVRNDGLMNRYSLQSKFGNFDVQGRRLLEIRIREIGALAELDRVSTSDVFLKAVSRTVAAPVETAVQFVEKPVETVTGIPKGVANLFKSYKLKGREAAKRAERGKEDLASGKADVSDTDAKVAREAKSYALQHLGVTKAERRWYAKLGVDPYTTNQPLRSAVTKLARVDATASFGMNFAGIPSIPGIDVVHRGMDAVWKEDPVLIRERNRRFLSSLGIDKDEIARFENNISLSPTHQVSILAMARALERVQGRGELVRRAMEVTSEDESLALIDSIGLLVRLHRQAPLAEIVGGIRLPAARTRDQRLVVCAGFDSVYWTQGVAEGAREIAQAYRDATESERQVLLAGSASPRVRAELETLGWKVVNAPAENSP